MEWGREDAEMENVAFVTYHITYIIVALPFDIVAYLMYRIHCNTKHKFLYRLLC